MCSRAKMVAGAKPSRVRTRLRLTAALLLWSHQPKLCVVHHKKVYTTFMATFCRRGLFLFAKHRLLIIKLF